MDTERTNRTILLNPPKVKLLNVLAFFRLWVPAPLLVVDEVGATYQPVSVAWFAHGKMVLPWTDIAAIYLNELSVQGRRSAKRGPKISCFLVFVPKNLEAFLAQHQFLSQEKPTLLRQAPLLVLTSLLGTPFAIPQQAIAPVSLDDLLAQIRTRFQAEIQAHGIEIRETKKIELSESTWPRETWAFEEAGREESPPEEPSQHQGEC